MEVGRNVGRIHGTPADFSEIRNASAHKPRALAHAPCSLLQKHVQSTKCGHREYNVNFFSISNLRSLILMRSSDIVAKIKIGNKFADT